MVHPAERNKDSEDTSKDKPKSPSTFQGGFGSSGIGGYYPGVSETNDKDEAAEPSEESKS